MAKVDGRPLKVDVYANPTLDAEGILISGFPDAYLTGAVASASVLNLGTQTVAGAAWTVVVGANSLTLSMPQAAVALIGEGRYTWTLILETAAGAKPSLIGGAFLVSRDYKPTSVPVSDTFASDPIGIDITIEQIVSSGAEVIDGGNAASSGSDILDGGHA